jgi:hypothetical protein
VSIPSLLCHVILVLDHSKRFIGIYDKCNLSALLIIRETLQVSKSESIALPYLRDGRKQMLQGLSLLYKVYIWPLERLVISVAIFTLFGMQKPIMANPPGY